MFNIMRYTYALNRKGLKAGSVYALNKGYALNNGVCLTTRVYGTKLIITIIKNSKSNCLVEKSVSIMYATLLLLAF